MRCAASRQSDDKEHLDRCKYAHRFDVTMRHAPLMYVLDRHAELAEVAAASPLRQVTVRLAIDQVKELDALHEVVYKDDALAVGAVDDDMEQADHVTVPELGGELRLALRHVDHFLLLLATMPVLPQIVQHLRERQQEGKVENKPVTLCCALLVAVLREDSDVVQGPCGDSRALIATFRLLRRSTPLNTVAVAPPAAQRDTGARV
jgi:hypothetical protein